jgi:hypothetical protein
MKINNNISRTLLYLFAGLLFFSIPDCLALSLPQQVESAMKNFTKLVRCARGDKGCSDQQINEARKTLGMIVSGLALFAAGTAVAVLKLRKRKKEEPWVVPVVQPLEQNPVAVTAYKQAINSKWWRGIQQAITQLNLVLDDNIVIAIGKMYFDRTNQLQQKDEDATKFINEIYEYFKNHNHDNQFATPEVRTRFFTFIEEAQTFQNK